MKKAIILSTILFAHVVIAEVNPEKGMDCHNNDSTVTLTVFPQGNFHQMSAFVLGEPTNISCMLDKVEVDGEEGLIYECETAVDNTQAILSVAVADGAATFDISSHPEDPFYLTCDSK